MEAKREGQYFSKLSKLSAEHLRAGMMLEYIRDLRRMAEILSLEKKNMDELKVLMLAFYVLLNCGEAIPAIDRELVSSIIKAAEAAGTSKHDVEELLLTTIHDDTAPCRNFTPRDSLYILELCLAGDFDGAETIVRRFGVARNL